MIGLVMYVKQGEQLWKDYHKNKKKRDDLSDEADFDKHTRWW